MGIKNKEALFQSKERKILLNVLEAGLDAIDTGSVIKKRITLSENILLIDDVKISLQNKEHIYIIGIGKCSQNAAFELENILGEKISGGVVIDVVCNKPFRYIEPCEGDHPYPTDRNIQGTERIIKLLEKTTEKDLVIFIISGGGSTLLCQPQNLTCLEEKSIVEHLFKKGATIQELNTIRKHISLARGGYLAKYAHPSEVVSLVFSDVPGDDLQFIASGPTIKDTTTIDDAKKIVEKYALREKVANEHLLETPKEEKYFEHVQNILFVSNKTALEAMKKKAMDEGFSAVIVNTTLSGEAKDVGREIVKRLHESPPQTILLYGGETTVTVGESRGKGGRNQELVLALISEIHEGEIFASCASDGWDNSNYAGALCDTITVKKMGNLQIDNEKFLKEHDSYHFFETVGDYIETGKTGANVSDLLIALKS